MSRLFIVACTLIAGLGISATAAARDTTPSATDQASHDSQKRAVADHRLVKPGDRNCLRHTGSLIPPKQGECLPVHGRSYSGDELRRTGAINNARALQLLDPSITGGH
jgi:hypothetical protein